MKPTDATLRVLAQITEAKSAVVINKGAITQVLAAGNIVKCMPDTILRLLVGGWLVTYGDGRLQPTKAGEEAADRWMGLHQEEVEGWSETP